MNAPLPVAERAAIAAEAPPVASDLQRLLQQPASFSTRDLLAGNALDKVLRLAEVMAASRITCPKHLQGNVGDCAAIIGQAMRWGMDHNAVAQKTHLVNGALGYEAQLVIAVLNSSPLLSGRINYRWADGWQGSNGKEDKSEAHWVECWATLRGESEPRVMRVSMAQVGSVRNSPNWASDARQQLAYLAAKRWGRLHAPDVILGVYTPDELQHGMSDDEAGAVPPPPAAPPAPPTWPADAFAAQLPRWTKAVEAGLKTAADILALARSKGALTAEQEAAITALKKAPPPEPITGEHADFVADMNAAEDAPQ